MISSRRRRRRALRDVTIDTEREVGHREETIEQAERHIVFRVLRVFAGLLVAGIGLALLALPGPGLIVIAIGLALLSRDVPFAGRLLARVRDKLPDSGDGPASAVSVAMTAGTVLISIAFGVWWAGWR
jgi:hypothetical protein